MVVRALTLLACLAFVCGCGGKEEPEVTQSNPDPAGLPTEENLPDPESPHFAPAESSAPNSGQPPTSTDSNSASGNSVNAPGLGGKSPNKPPSASPSTNTGRPAQPVRRPRRGTVETTFEGQEPPPAPFDPQAAQALMASSGRLIMNNMKQIALAVHGYHDAHSQTPPAITYGPDGKPWHSWRALILPYLDRELGKRYRLDEPWDGPNNKQLLQDIPSAYLLPGQKGTNTAVVAAAGNGTLLTKSGKIDASGKISGGVFFGGVRDGLSQTIVVGLAPAGLEIPWTKPEDLVFTTNFPGMGSGRSFGAPLAKPGGVRGGIFAMGDGSVRFLPAQDSDQWLPKALTPRRERSLRYAEVIAVAVRRGRLRRCLVGAVF